MKRPNRRRQLTVYVPLAILAVILFIYAQYEWALRPVTSSAPTVEFTVQSGERVPKIADALKAANLIRDRNAFITYVTIHDIRAKLEAGTYSLSAQESSQEIASILAHGQTLSDRLVIPEGYRLNQIEQLASEDGIPASDFEAALAAPHTQSFLATKPAGVGLEGYLFPDSYQINKTTTATQLVEAMLNNFGSKVGIEYAQAFAAEGLTLHQGLTLASIVEGEVSNQYDRPIVAQIFLKRLKLGMSLGSDVTACYASQDLMRMSACDVNVDSPYNTTNRVGLPPGPIDSPGLNSLDAVAHPASTDYLYFLTGKDGKDYFATTYAQHEDNIAKYLN
jgi:peptidoglycan lytic transglycosylase G